MGMECVMNTYQSYMFCEHAHKKERRVSRDGLGGDGDQKELTFIMDMYQFPTRNVNILYH